MTDFVQRRVIKSENPLLGRNIEFDPRSLAFRSPLLGADADVRSVRHHINIGLLDQEVGSCTCNNQVNMIASDQVWSALTPAQQLFITLNPNAAVLDWYREVSRSDEYPGAWEPDDTGSSGTSASKITVKRQYARGYVNGYSSYEAKILIQNGMIGTGTYWYSSFNRPAADGRVEITSSAYRQGGHQYTGVEYDAENDRWVWLNSWGDWGVDGEFWFDTPTFDRLLREDGDVVQLVPNSEPQPEPDWDLMLYQQASSWAYGRLFARWTKAGKAADAFVVWAEKKGLRMREEVGS